jgi:hypothetical protein
MSEKIHVHGIIFNVAFVEKFFGGLAMAACAQRVYFYLFFRHECVSLEKMYGYFCKNGKPYLRFPASVIRNITLPEYINNMGQGLNRGGAIKI